MYFNGEYTWQQFQKLEGVRKLPLQEQIKHYNKYLSDLSIQRSLVENYINQNSFQSFQGTAASAAGAGGNPVTASFYAWNFAFAATSASACYSASVFPTIVYYTPSSSIQLGAVLYTDYTLLPAATASTGFYSYNNDWFRITGSGVVAASGSCVSIATPFGLSYDVNYNGSGTSSACTSASVFRDYNTNYYLASSAGLLIDINDTLYTNSSLTSPVPSGSYSDGTKWYRVSGSGVVRSTGSCS